jgi:hypothetical protein
MGSPSTARSLTCDVFEGSSSSRIIWKMNDPLYPPLALSIFSAPFKVIHSACSHGSGLWCTPSFVNGTSERRHRSRGTCKVKLLCRTEQNQKYCFFRVWGSGKWRRVN